MITHDELADWILIALGDLGGSATRARVLDVMEGQFGGCLAADDRGRRKRGEIVWKNNASFARDGLVKAGLLLSKTVSGHGTWTLSPAGKRKSQALRANQDAPLCPSFRSIAANVTWSTAAGRLVGLVPMEPTFTDNALLALAIQHSGQIKIQRFTSYEEAQSGADWEWWIRDRYGYAGFRVQAKRANPVTAQIALDQRAATTASFEKQIEVFVNRCRTDNILGLYCIYSDWQPSRPQLAGPGPCPHGPADLAQWGCTIVFAETALRLTASNQRDADTMLCNGMPWYHLVCQAGASVTIGVRRVVERMVKAEVAIRPETDELKNSQLFCHRQHNRPPRWQPSFKATSRCWIRGVASLGWC
nr:winged helix-turn-helix domain-containing protein [Micromonospora provocatoris]